MRTFAERRGTPDLAEYGKRLRKDPSELDAFLDRVTINVSHLWRHEDQFEVLRTKLLPELGRAQAPEDLERRLAPTAPRPTRSPPSAARRSRRIPVEITGTDLDKRMVARAREGVFTR